MTLKYNKVLAGHSQQIGVWKTGNHLNPSVFSLPLALLLSFHPFPGTSTTFSLPLKNLISSWLQV